MSEILESFSFDLKTADVNYDAWDVRESSPLQRRSSMGSPPLGRRTSLGSFMGSPPRRRGSLSSSLTGSPKGSSGSFMGSPNRKRGMSSPPSKRQLSQSPSGRVREEASPAPGINETDEGLGKPTASIYIPSGGDGKQRSLSPSSPAKKVPLFGPKQPAAQC